MKPKLLSRSEAKHGDTHKWTKEKTTKRIQKKLKDKMRVNKYRVLYAIISVMLIGCKSYAQIMSVPKKCNLCCDTSYIDIVIGENFEAFTLLIDTNTFKRNAISFKKPVSFWKPSEKDVFLSENVLERDVNIVLNSFLLEPETYKSFKRYIRQYAGITSDKGKRYLLISFNNSEFIEDYCSKYFKIFSTDLCRMHFQRFGNDFFLLFDMETMQFNKFSRTIMQIG